jgi:hypothetical protein
MGDNDRGSKGAPGELRVCRQCNDSRRSPLAGERHILELISLGAPLPGILNKLCAAIDVQIGNVVSLVLLPDGEGNSSCSITRSAAQFSLNLFSSTSIRARDKSVLGVFQIYCCDQRDPTPQEAQMIGRVIHLAALALQRCKDTEHLENPYRRGRRETGGSAPKTPPFIN